MADEEIIEQLSPGEGSGLDSVSKLNDTLRELKSEIDSSCSENIFQIIISAFICLIIIYFGYELGYDFYTYKDFPCWWTWQMIYFTTARIIIVSGFFYVAIFFFKLLKSYLYAYQRNRHRQFVINSMSNLIVSGTGYGKMNINEIYKTILDIITGFDESGILQKDADSNSLPVSVIEKLISIMSKVSK